MNQTITQRTLDKHIYKSDMSEYTHSLTSIHKKHVLDKSLKCSSSLDENFEIKTVIKNKKPCYSLVNFHQIIVCRNLASNIHISLKKNKSRNEISRQLVQHLKEGTSYRIYRLDIKSFFESIRTETISESLKQDSISTQTKLLTERIISEAHKIGAVGLPRGLEFSPAIAELILQEFDKKIYSLEGVFYYSRYVDDILVITSGIENKREFLKYMKSCLPEELNFNYNKQNILNVPKRKHTPTNVVALFDYLGYEYKVIDNALAKKDYKKSVFRQVQVSLSKSKLKKIKTRVYKAIYCYLKDGDFDLLKDRMTFLTSNRLMNVKKTGKIVELC